MISIQSPTRVDLAGGTLDMWPLYNFVGGASTINLAISVFTYAEIEDLPGTEIQIESVDINAKLKYRNLEEALQSAEPQLALYKPVLSFFRPNKGFRLKTRSESPVGGGLGGSSSLTISILKAFAAWTGQKFKSADEMVLIAHNLEAKLLCTPTGTQDYYPAVDGGLNIIDFTERGIQSQSMSFQNTPFESQMSLVYTGKAHHSGLNNFEVLQGAVKKDQTTLSALKDIKQIADQMRKTCMDRQWSELPVLFSEEYKARIRLCASFSSPEISNMHQIALRHGADAVKICGAGGGGCVFVWSPTERKAGVESALKQAGFQVLPAIPVDKGSLALKEKIFL